jgi:6-phospho-3-hexuloisomerase
VDRFGAATGFLLDEARSSLKQVDDGSLEAFLGELDDARHVVVFGRGRSGRVAQTFAIRLGHLGYRAFFVGETSTPPVREDDLVVLVSGSGETFSVTLTAQIARDMQATVACVTASPESVLPEHSDLVVELPVGQETKRQRKLAPMGTRFELAAHVLFDGLVAELMHRLDEDEVSMRDRHATLE